MGERFTLQLPADPAYVATARMFASTLARGFAVDDDTVEDLKLAVSEACARALAAELRSLSMVAERVDGRLRFEVAQGEPRPRREPTTIPTSLAPELAASLNVELVTALFDDAEVAAGPEGPVLRFSLAAAG